MLDIRKDKNDDDEVCRELVTHKSAGELGLHMERVEFTEGYAYLIVKDPWDGSCPA